MSDKLLMECWVCGEPASTRCGACGKEGIDIAFCGREHQKLVWPVHKLVCGAGKANPFIWPRISNEEAADLDAHLDDRFCVTTDTGTTLVISVREWLATRNSMMNSQMVEEIIAALRERVTPENLSDPSVQDLITMVRTAESFRTTTTSTEPLPSISTPRRALLRSSGIVLPYFRAFSFPTTRPPWWSEAHHRILFLSYLSALAKETRRAELLRYVGHAHLRAERVAVEGMKATHPGRVGEMTGILRQVAALY
ncbi:hypothetical protein JCM6882_000824 [Rhodosporidiobolus microsporus]